MLGVKGGSLRGLWLGGPQGRLPAALTWVGSVPGRGSMKAHRGIGEGRNRCSGGLSWLAVSPKMSLTWA